MSSCSTSCFRRVLALESRARQIAKCAIFLRHVLMMAYSLSRVDRRASRGAITYARPLTETANFGVTEYCRQFLIVGTGVRATGTICHGFSAARWLHKPQQIAVRCLLKPITSAHLSQEALTLQGAVRCVTPCSITQLFHDKNRWWIQSEYLISIYR